ncbi:hypothetical protein BDV97DRAFT_195607 [Delphinella strobiligena]|nr:hypothetical protein BDV97DRAFT_195607 [Delphinella strobiligena]
MISHFAIIIIVLVGCIAATAIVAAMARMAGFSLPTHSRDAYRPTGTQKAHMNRVHDVNMRRMALKSGRTFWLDAPIVEEGNITYPASTHQYSNHLTFGGGSLSTSGSSRITPDRSVREQPKQADYTDFE